MYLRLLSPASESSESGMYGFVSFLKEMVRTAEIQSPRPYFPKLKKSKTYIPTRLACSSLFSLAFYLRK